MLDEIGGKRRQSFVMVIRPAILDHYILALAVATLLQALPERAQAVHIGLRARADIPNHRHRRLLRPRQHRPRRRRAADKGKELAPSHFAPRCREPGIPTLPHRRVEGCVVHHSKF